MGDHGVGQQQLAPHLVAQLVELGGEALQVTPLHPPGEVVPGLRAREGGDGDDRVREPGAVRLVEVPQEAGLVALGQDGAEVVAHGVLEVAPAGADQAVHLVQEQHRRYANCGSQGRVAASSSSVICSTRS